MMRTGVISRAASIGAAAAGRLHGSCTRIGRLGGTKNVNLTLNSLQDPRLRQTTKRTGSSTAGPFILPRVPLNYCYGSPQSSLGSISSRTKIMPPRHRAASASASAASYHSTTNVPAKKPGQRQPYNDAYDYDSESSSPPLKKVLVLGSSGALGSVIARHLMTTSPPSSSSSNASQVHVLGADVQAELPPELFTDDWRLTEYCSLLPSSSSSNDKNSSNDASSNKSSLEILTQKLVDATQQFLSDTNSPGLDAIICASGGWQADPAMSSSETVDSTSENDIARYAASMQRMHNMNVEPVLAAAYLAQRYLNPNSDSLLVVLGATAALQPAPGMLLYGLSKVSAHYIVQTLGAASATSLESKSIKQAAKDYYFGSATSSNPDSSMAALRRCTVLGILPTMLDTPNNRRSLPKHLDEEQLTTATASWTRPLDIAEQIGTWLHQPAVQRPHSGALLKVYPQNQHRAQHRMRTFSDESEGARAVFEIVR